MSTATTLPELMEGSESRESPATAAVKQLSAHFNGMKEPGSPETLAERRLIALFDLMEASEPPATRDEHLLIALRDLVKQLESLETVAESHSIALFRLAAKLPVRDDEEAEVTLCKLPSDLLPFLDQVVELKDRYSLMRIVEQETDAWTKRFEYRKSTWKTQEEYWNRHRIALEAMEELLKANAESAKIELEEEEAERKWELEEKISGTVDQADTYQTETDTDSDSWSVLDSWEHEEAIMDMKGMTEAMTDEVLSAQRDIDEGRCPQERL